MKIVSIAISKKRCTTKKCIDTAELIKNFGIKGDAHAGDYHRQLSFLASKRIEEASTKDFELNNTFNTLFEANPGQSKSAS